MSSEMNPFKGLVGMAVGALAASLLAVSPASARRDQDAAYQAAKSGQIRSLPDIRKKMRGRMHGARPVGEEYDSGSRTYRMKYLRGGSVIWVDVDARTGAVLDRSDD